MNTEAKIRRKARQFAHQLLDKMADGHADQITVEWLMQKHPTLNKKEAESYRLFCKKRTIVFKSCYGEGQIMWPKWQESKKAKD